MQPKIVRRTISADTAATLTGIMEGVVERGTARLAQMPGFTVAGKKGANTVHFTGRIGGKKLSAGSYRITGVPTDAAGNTGKPVTATFRIKR